ncbi:MAG: VTT domain-containing protein [Clostridiales bacterium]|nr:VTT domain-containing protein [Clostridiales bacterium]
MKKSTSRIIVIASLIAVILMFAFFLKDILIPYIRLELANDLDGAKELLISKGFLGLLTVVLVEGLEMVVVFISAEFIQIASGMSYPFYIAIALCDLGVCLGASIIFVLVKAFKFTSQAYEKNEEKIARIAQKSKKDRSTVLLMYLLFIMPLIPFGAICYYGSRTKLKYGRYILTVATGAIPSIVTSILMGTAAKYFIGNDLPLPVLILIIVALAAVLFLILFIFLDRVYFKENDKTPDSVIYSLFFRIAEFLRKRRQRLIIDDSALKELKPPFIILANHCSFYDFYYVKKFVGWLNPAYVVNRHIISAPVIRKLAHKAGFIPKRLFNVDFTTPIGIMRMIKAGYPVVIFPEGRLSITGRNYPVVEKSGNFYKKLGVDVVIVKIKGAFFANPKWRKSFYKSDISVGVERVIKAEELNTMTADGIDRAILEALSYDESRDAEPVWTQHKKAEGLENILYRCIDCGALYSTKGEGNDLVCSECGSVRHLNEYYRFDGEPGSIDGYYERIKAVEREELTKPDFRLETDVKTVVYSEKGRFKRRSSGRCVLTKEGLSYTSGHESFMIERSMLPALPFSCSEEFEAYHDDKLYYFYPVETRRQVARWALFLDLMEESKNETEG